MNKQLLIDNQTSEIERNSLEAYAKSLIGKRAQSTLITCLNDKGQRVMEAAMPIVGYELVEWCGAPALMLTLDSEVSGPVSVFEDSICNIR